MTSPSDFRPGDRVHHPVMGDGEVTSIAGGAVHVTYDQHDARGNTQQGVYGAAWFRIVGGLKKVKQP